MGKEGGHPGLQCGSGRHLRCGTNWYQDSQDDRDQGDQDRTKQVEPPETEIAAQDQVVAGADRRAVHRGDSDQVGGGEEASQLLDRLPVSLHHLWGQCDPAFMRPSPGQRNSHSPDGNGSVLLAQFGSPSNAAKADFRACRACAAASGSRLLGSRVRLKSPILASIRLSMFNSAYSPTTS